MTDFDWIHDPVAAHRLVSDTSYLDKRHVTSPPTYLLHDLLVLLLKLCGFVLHHFDLCCVTLTVCTPNSDIKVLLGQEQRHILLQKQRQQSWGLLVYCECAGDPINSDNPF